MLDTPLPADLQQLVTDEMTAGNYETPQAVVRAGVERLRQDREEFERIHAEVQIGIDQIRRGEYREYNDETLDEFFEEIKRKGRERLDDQRARQGVQHAIAQADAGNYVEYDRAGLRAYFDELKSKAIQAGKLSDRH